MYERKRKTTSQFIEQAKKVHGDAYDYGKTSYISKRLKVCITCPQHGDFWQNAQSHLHGCGCKECMKDRFRISYEEFLRRAHEIHGYKYDYSLINKESFKGVESKIDIICPTHGIFHQKAANHLNGKGCAKCGFESLSQQKRLSDEEYFSRAKSLYGDRFGLSKVKWHNLNTRIIVTCPLHGDFTIKTSYFLRGYGCPQCDGFKKFTTDYFISRAKEIHGDRYNYDKVDYKKAAQKVEIICNICGEHFYQTPNSHLKGGGCPRCEYSHGEERISVVLNSLKIKYKPQYKICNESLFCKNRNMYLDFFIPSLNLAIEFQGEQHYHPVGYTRNEKKFAHQQERDNAVRQYCKEHKIQLLEISYEDYDDIDLIIKKNLKRFYPEPRHL